MTIALPPDKEWLTAKQAAEEQLPGFQYQERQIRNLISSGELKAAKRAGRGGGREFHYTSLPAEARRAYEKKYAIAAPAQVAHRGARVMTKELIAEAQADIVKAAWAAIDTHGMKVGEGLAAFAVAYNTGATKLDDSVHRAVARITVAQLREWRAKLNQGEGWTALIDGRGRKKGSGLKQDYELYVFLREMMGARPHISATTLQKAIATARDAAISPGMGRDIALRTLQLLMAPLRPERNALTLAAADPDRFRGKHRASLGSRSQGITRLNQEWQMDATKADCFCLVDGRPVRMHLTALVDVQTRRAMIVVSDQPRNEASRAVIRRACIAWGMPERIKTDNGKEFKNKAVDRFCAMAGIELKFCRPYNPQEKPFVESFFGTILEQLFEVLPGYLGHNVAQRKAIENRKSFAEREQGPEEAQRVFQVSLSPADLQQRIDLWLEHEYETRWHSGIGMPPRTMAQALDQEKRAVEDVRLLDALMMNVVERNIQKGMIRIANRFYGSEETGELTVTAHERKVQCFIDPLDPTWIAVYSADGTTFECVARDLALLDPEERKRLAIASLQRQNKVVQLFNGRVRAQRRNTHGLADQLLADAAGVPDHFLGGEAGQAMIGAQGTKLLTQHRDMVDARDAMDAPAQHIALTDEQRENAAAVRAEMAARGAPRAERFVQCDGYQRPEFLDDDFGYFDWAQARLASAEPLDAPDYAAFEALKRDETFARMRANRKRAAQSACEDAGGDQSVNMMERA